LFAVAGFGRRRNFHQPGLETPMKLSRWALLAAPLALAGCGGFGQAMNANSDVLAKAAGKELKIEEAASLIALNPQIEATPEVVRQLADRWVDYVLLATAVAEDTSLAVLNLDEFIRPEQEQQLIMRTLQSGMRLDTTFTDAELQEAWASKGPGAEVRARHILFQVPNDATPAQRDSTRRLAEQVRGRAAGGADFAELARQYSADGSAQQGGDLGFFGRGRMVPAFEQAAFALQPGQISAVVETPFGYHIIKTEEKRSREMGAEKEQFRTYLVQNAQQEGFQKYVDSLTTAAKVEVQPGAAELVKELAAQGDLQIRGRAAERKLVTFRGGELTTGELMQELQGAPPQVLEQFKNAQDEQINDVLKNQATKELLLADASRRKVELSKPAVDSLRTQAKESIRQILQVAGLQRVRAPKGSAGNAEIERQVRDLLQGAVAGQRQMPPLGRLGYQLRGVYGSNVNTAVFEKVVERVKSLRAVQPQVQAPGQQGQGPMQQPQQPGGQPVPPAAQPQGQPQTAPQGQPQAAPQGGQAAPAPAGQTPGGR
jgi:peptidyl-prolyl cis-trans isomerase C